MKPGRFLVFLSVAIFAIALLMTIIIRRDGGGNDGIAWPASAPLPQPSTVSNAAFEDTLYSFLRHRSYANLPGWAQDKRVRDTGPYINGQYYGTHPAVRIFYSPNLFQWLKNGRNGDAPEGSFIIKEMFGDPAAKYMDLTDAQIADTINGWTVMIRDSDGSWDGWYWGSYFPNSQEVDNPEAYTAGHGYHVPESGFGTYCMRCHASADHMLTFSSLRNIKGEAGNPIQYHYDDSWLPRNDLATATAEEIEFDNEHEIVTLVHMPLMRRIMRLTGSQPGNASNPNFTAFTEFFQQLQPVRLDSVVGIPPRPYDNVTSGPKGPQQFITASTCMPCHSASAYATTGINMFIPDTTASNGKGWNVSPYGEWQGSMMGLAGRDPIFFAQLESEKAIHHQDTLPNFIQNTCLSCHGVMGQRQFHVDKKGSHFKEEMMYAKGEDEWEMYGGLGRDGISCMVCHQIVDDGKPLMDIVTGKFDVSKPGEYGQENGKDISYVWGPYESDDIVEHPMAEGLGIRPKFNPYIKESRLCASCHVVYLPVFTDEGKPAKDPDDPSKDAHFYEQTTYLEWQNSGYQNEFEPNGNDVQTCQSCHMPTTFPFDGNGTALRDFKIANVQDQSYPESDHVAPFDSLYVRRRDTFHRHTLLGINQFGLEFFNQFDSILGNYKMDYMTGTEIIPQAINASQTLAISQTAKVTIAALSTSGSTLNADVHIESLVGHRLPSGVGFRRAFLEFTVYNKRGQAIWSSGSTNAVGVILGPNGQPLPSEFFDIDPVTGKQLYEPHYDTIVGPGQVQIYQELATSPEGLFTTSFVSLLTKVKDNRFLPKGWTHAGPAGMNPEHVEETRPVGNAASDPNFGAGGDQIHYKVQLPSGQRAASVVATLYYQAIPPSYLKDRFTTAKGKDGQRLYYLASNLETDGTNIKDWKLKISGERKVVGGK